MRNPIPPKLVVCDLDQDLLNNRDCESALLDTWLSWEPSNRPLLTFHSARTVEELQRMLPSSVLPSADFLIGAGTEMLVRHSFWNHDRKDDNKREFDGFSLEHMLASMASNALAQLHTPIRKAGFAEVENAVLTIAGLSITFASNGKGARLSAPNAPLAWLLAQLQLDTSEIRTYIPEVGAQPRRISGSAR